MTRPRNRGSGGKIPEWAKALKERRFQLGLSQEQIEERSGGVIAQKTISAVENGITPLLGMALSRARSYARALDWSLKDMQEATGLDFGVPANEPSWTLSGQGVPPRKPYLALDGAVQTELVTIPVLALASAGKGAYVDEDVVGYVDVAREIARHPHRVTFAVEGESMEATLSHGDVVHVDRADTSIRDSKIYIVELEGDGYAVKRAKQFVDDSWQLVSDNPRFPPLQRDDVRVIGRVFGVSPQMRRL